MGGPGALSPVVRGTLPTLITLPAVPHMPLRFGLGLLLVKLVHIEGMQAHFGGCIFRQH